MEMLLIILALLIAAILLAVAELALPSGGLLGVLAVACLAGAVVASFFIHTWVGAAVLLACMIFIPIAFSRGVDWWQKSPFGSTTILTTNTGRMEADQPVETGTPGTTLTALRPMGEVVIGPRTYQATTAAGYLPAGTPVRVLSHRDGVLTVEPAEPSATDLS